MSTTFCSIQWLQNVQLTARETKTKFYARNRYESRDTRLQKKATAAVTTTKESNEEEKRREKIELHMEYVVSQAINSTHCIHFYS